jgi:hypothetical protein
MKKEYLFGLLLVIFLVLTVKSQFNNQLSGEPLTDLQPKIFPPIDNAYPPDVQALAPPTVKEEIGLGILYPQGTGVGMSKYDSNSFTYPGGLLTNYSIPTAYAESNLADPTGMNGADRGSRILKIKSTGNQMMFKPVDEAENVMYAGAYSENIEVQNGATLINGSKAINYNDNFVPGQNLKIQSSPGQMSSLANCETTYPRTEHYDNLCITEGDIPYFQVINGNVNPRHVSRWESYTGDYSRAEALQNLDGNLYPTLTVLTN